MKRILTLLTLTLLLPLALIGQVTAEFSANPQSGCSPLVVNFSDLSTGSVTTWSWNFGNGNTSTLQNPAAVYVNPGTYTVSLTVSDGSNSDTETKVALVTVFQNPTSNFAATSPTGGCAPHSVTFQDQSTPGDTTITGWLWDFGDGTTSSNQNPTHTFTNAGSFNVTLVVTDANGCSNTFLIPNYINVSNTPNVAFSGAPLGACTAPHTVMFTDNSSGGQAPLSYLWDFGDGNTSTAQNASHTYTATGSYTVSLIVTDANGCADTLTQNNYVNINPVVAGFTAAPTTICEGQAVAFTNTTTGGATAYQWDFGDGNTSTNANPNHTYANAGTYSVTLIATSGAGCGDTLTQTNLVTVNPGPTAAFAPDSSVACAFPFTVNFTDQSTGATAWAWDFGDGNTSNAQNPSHTYTAAGTYPVTLTVTSANGCTDQVVFNNVVIQEPVADFVGNPLNGCIPLPVTFTDQSTSNFPITSWQWDFGDGGTSTGQNPTHTYTTAGTFTVTLIITNSNGCTDTLVRPNYVIAGTPPIASFTANPLFACVNDPITFTDLSTNANTWFWEFGDGGTSTAQNPVYAYQDTGCFTVTLTVTNNGCMDDTVITNYICISPPLARFNLNPAVGCAVPHTVFFTDNSILPDTWLWDFGDGSTSTAQNPIHTYTATGNYTVRLTVTDTITGCSDDATAVVNISIPIADFTGTPLFGCGPLTVNFTDNSTGAGLTYAWDFGDGGTSTAQNPTHVYQNPGTYTVTLTVTDGNGCTDTRTRTNYVQVIGPDVNFGAAPTGGCVPLTVNFSDSTVFGAPITGWTWDFGDGNSSNLQNPSHTYTNSGTYTVSLTVTDIDGCSRTFTQNNFISVTQPVALFSVTDTVACTGFAVGFTNQSSGTGLTYLWDFGDGTTSTQANPTHAYASTGNYTISLQVTDVNGCDSSYVDSTAVQIIPVLANFGAAPTSASCPPLLVLFSDSSSFDIVSWEWDFGDGAVSTLQNPSHVYAAAGSYDVSLIVENSQGCRDTIFTPGLINIAGPNGTFAFAPDSGCTPLTVDFNANATNTALYTWDFGDGTVAVTTVDSVLHTYTQTGTFFPVLILDDGAGCTFTVTTPDSVVVDTVPFPDFSASTNVICGLDSVAFTDLTVSTRPITSWFWDFGDGGTDSIQNPTHFYGAPGSYNVQLTVTNSLGCIDSIVIPAPVIVVQAPNAAIAASDTVGCAPLLVQFIDSSTSSYPLVAWDWDFGDGSSSNQQNPQHFYGAAGTYNVQLIVTDSLGCQDTAVLAVEARPGPTGSFIANDSLGCAPFPVVFTAGSGFGIVNYFWDFGDGSSGTGNPVSHTYTGTGAFSVTLIVEDTLGCRDTVVNPNYIIIDPPTADFTPNPQSGCPPLAVTFNDASTSTYPIVTWTWDFGDGNTGTGNPVAHTYANPGQYSVQLIVEDSVGCRDTILKNNLITVFAPPSAGFFVLDTLNCDPFTIELSDTSTATGTIGSWDWDFGDGNTSNVQNPIHAYAATGNYTIRLIVTDNNGCQDTAFLPIFAPAPPVANFAANDSLGCAPFPVTFTSTSSGIITSHFWDFGDGTTGTGNPVTHTYTQSGTYTVSLIVEDTLGCRDTLVKQNYIIIDPPSADFAPNNAAGCPVLAVTFTDASTSTYPITNYDWDFGDGNTGTGNPVNHSYQNPGLYTVTLIITDSVGCQDTIAKPNLIEVYTPPSAGFFPSDTIGCDPFTVEFTDSSSSPNTIVNWDWDFGDGGTSTAQNPIHPFSSGPGTYQVQLIVKDNNGCSDTVINPFTVPIRPIANFVASDSLGCNPLVTTLTADSVDIVSWDWDFGDGNTASGNPVTHTYTQKGRFGITLIIQDIYGCFDTLFRPNYIFVDTLVANFNFNQGSGCPPLPVTFLDSSWSDTTVVSWQWDFGDGGTSNQQNPTYTYNTPGNYNVTLVVTNALGCTDTISDSLPEIFDLNPPVAPPIYMATVLNNTRDSISWMSYQANDFSHYVLYRENPTGSNNWVAIDSFFNWTDTTYIDGGLNTLDFSYCYKMIVVDVCGLRSDLNASQEHCTIELDAVGVLNASQLNWSAYVGWGNVLEYEVYRVNDYTSNVQFLGTVPGNVTSYTDSVIVCYETYCYRVRAIEDGGFSQVSWSDTACATPIYEPNQLPMEVVNATVENNAEVRVNWFPPPIPTLAVNLERSQNNNNWNLLATLPPNQLTYLDPNVNVQEQSYYYRLNFVDSCGDVSPYSNHGRSIVLDVDLRSGSPFLEWNPYSEWQVGVNQYEIEVFNDLLQQWQYVDQVNGITTEYHDRLTDLNQPIYCYRVWAREQGGNQSFSLSNEDCIPVGPLLYAPNAFSPNGDGINDKFLLKGRFVQDYLIRIFDRWGQLVYESSNLADGWDGFYKGVAAQEEVYTFVATGKGYDDTEIVLSGTCTLIR